jgi:membrane protease YdiL (CAAX protease family)
MMDELWQTKRAPVWALVAVAAVHVAFTPFFNFVVFPRHWLVPLSHATFGLVDGTLQANLIIIAVIVFGLIFLGAGLRPADVGWRSNKLPVAILFTLGLWAVLNLLAIAGAEFQHLPFAFDESWTKPGLTRTFGMFIGQIFGNSLAEETIFRGFLMVQLMLIFRPLGKVAAGVGAVIVVQAFFASIHIPELREHGLSWTDVLETLPELALAGTMLAIVYLATGNLFVAVGTHALSDISMLVVSNGFNIHDNSGFAYLGLGLLASLVWRFVWSRFKPRAAGT